jgi:hypothetical protein
MPRRLAWALFLAAAALAFLAIVKLAWTVTGLPVWLEPSAICALALGCVLWTIPGNPNPPA